MPPPDDPVVLIVDDDPSLRDALSSLLRSVGLRVEVFGSAPEMLEAPLPDVASCLVLDIRLPKRSGLDFQNELIKASIKIPIIFITAHGDVPMSVRAMKAGAVDFLTKPVKRDILLDAVERALARDATQRTTIEQADQMRARFASLTPRQREVFDLIVAGKLNKQIADMLDIAERTVKREREQVMTKLSANSAADLGRLAELLQRLSP